MEEDEFINCLHNQNLEYSGFSEKEMKEGVKLKFKEKSTLTCANWVIECKNKIREDLLQKRRVYLDFASSRIIDYLAVSRSNKCQGYDDVFKYCRKSGGNTCVHCAENGHTFKECGKLEHDPVCSVFKSAKSLLCRRKS